MEETTTPSLTEDIVKSIAISAATTVGMVAGLAIVGAVMEMRERRNQKKINPAK